jgi:LmbE family N-acetylglucosaminyl deacetylase
MNGNAPTVLAIAVHPDDETLGCGGTLLKHRTEGSAVHWLLLTAAHEPEFPAEQIRQQQRQVDEVKAALPFSSLHWLRLPSTRLDQRPLQELVTGIRKVVETVRPAIVYVPNHTDVHSDHRVAAAAVHAVLKSFYLRSLGVRRVLACEVMSETDAAPPLPGAVFVPNVTVDISATLERKLALMALFRSEVHPEPGPRSPSAIRALARVRGATIGVEYGEAFMLVREIA